MHKKKRLLLTGGTGFIGHHTVEHILKNTNWTIVILDSLSYAGNLHRLTDILVFDECFKAGRIEIVHHNIQAPIPTSIAARIGHVDHIIHMAAETHVDRSIVDAQPFVMTNFVGTYNMLEFARTISGLEMFLQISTDEVFGPATHVSKGFLEWDRHKPSNPYAATKAAADDLVYSYFKTHDLPVMITHSMNNFGERQHPEKFIFKTLMSLLQGDAVEIHGTKRKVGSRCWLHARNHADAILFLLQHGKAGEKYNIAGEEMTNLEMARVVADVSGVPLKPRFVDFHKCRPGHDRRYALNADKMRKMGWVPPMALVDSLAKCIEWTIDRQNDWLLAA